jgi:opacity protein-like surface antigen
VGAGLEYMLTANWSVRAEYLYYHFNRSQNLTATATGFAFFPSNYVWSSTNINVARAGVSYKF